MRDRLRGLIYFSLGTMVLILSLYFMIVGLTPYGIYLIGFLAVIVNVEWYSYNRKLQTMQLIELNELKNKNRYEKD